MNVVNDLIARIEARYEETANPCKSYATEERAEAVARAYSVTLANYFSRCEGGTPARYIVAFSPAMGRWVIGFDLTELMRRSTFTGGYIGVASDKGFYTY